MNFEKIDQYLDTLPQCGIPACSFLVTHKGKEVYSHSAGFADLEGNRPADVNDLYWVCSITKVTTCVAAMQLVESGRIKLDDPVSKYLPAFSELYVRGEDKKSVYPAKTVLTVEHLFTMTGGFGYDINSDVLKDARANPNASTQEVVNALAKEALFFEPGTHFRYSLCHDILAAVVEVASGMLFRDYLKKFILDPLDMKDTGFHLPKELESRMTTMYNYTHGISKSTPIECKNKYCLTDNYDSGGAGLYTTPADQIKMLTTLANGGKAPDGSQILRPETIRMMGENRLCDTARADFMPTRLYGYGWGLCGRAHVNPTLSRARSSVGEFGWDGATGSFALVDPEKQVAMFFGLHILGCQYIYHAVHPTLRDMTYEALGI